MKKKYITFFIIVACALLFISIAVGIRTNYYLNKLSKEKYFEISDYQIESVNTITNENLKLKSYNFISTKNSLVNEYVFKTKSSEEILASYKEFLINEKGYLLETSSSEKTTLLTFLNSENKFKINLNLTATKSNFTIIIEYSPISN